MCIRDSQYTVTATPTSGASGSISCTSPVNGGSTTTCTSTPGVGFRTASTVSYTHLDVYKRQARGNRAGGVRQHRYHRHRTTAQLGSQLLLDRGKVAVEIDVQRAKHVPILLDVITVFRVIVWLAAFYARSKPRFPEPPSDAKSSPTH